MVLLSNKIEQKIREDLLVVDPNIITDFDQITPQQKYDNVLSLKNQISHASYNIRVGENVAIEGGNHQKVLEYETVTIKPFEVAIIETYEKVKMPLNLIGRWNIRVKLAYQGLIWVGGPQVDPGYCGHLYCPIYNMSDKEVTLKLKDTIATMDFVETTKPDQEFKGFNSHVKPFEYYKSFKLKSALTTNVQDKMEKLDEFKDKMEERLHKLQTTFLTVIGALFATLSILIISMKTNSTTQTCNIATFIAIGISIYSLMLHSHDIVPTLKKLLNIFSYIGIIILIIFIGIFFEKIIGV